MERKAKPSHADERLAELVGAVANLNDNFQQLHHGIKTIGAVRLLGAEPKTLNGTASQRIIANAAGRIAGWDIHETSGTNPVVIRLHEGQDATGELRGIIQLPANGAASPWFLPHGKAFANGLYLELVSGTFEGVLWLATHVR